MKENTANNAMDYNIRSNVVRVIVDQKTNESKVMSKDEAIELAHSQNMNLVEISFTKDTYPGSICKIMDYAKFKYDQKKRQKEIAKKARANRSELKSLSFSIRIDENDKNIKLRHAREFLEKGDKVELDVFLSKREMARKEMAIDLLKELCTNLSDVSMIEGKVKAEGRSVSCVVVPVKK